MMSTIIADGTISAITLAITSEIEICQYYSLLACPLQECKDESHLTFQNYVVNLLKSSINAADVLILNSLVTDNLKFETT